MKNRHGSGQTKNSRWENRMAIMGVTMVVAFFAVTVNAKSAGLKKTDRNYEVRESEVQAKLDDEKKRTEELNQYKIHVTTKQYAEEVAKEKLGLVRPDEILLKPSE